MSGDLNSFSFTSREMGSDGAFRFWRESLFRYDSELGGEAVADFSVDLTTWLAGALIFGSAIRSPLAVARDRVQVTDGYDDILFTLILQGEWHGEAEGRPFHATVGDTICLDAARPFRIVNGPTDYRFVVVPRRLLPALKLANPALHGHVLRSASSRILLAHVEAVTRRPSPLDGATAVALSKGTLALMKAALGEIEDHAPPVAACPVPADKQTLLREVERFVEMNLSSADLAPDTLARELGISRSVLYRAFAPLGGVSNYIQSRRLAIAHELLLHPEEHRSLGELAGALGFGSQVAFAKAFRRRYGCSPRAVRGEDLSPAGSARDLFDIWLGVKRRIETGLVIEAGA